MSFCKALLWLVVQVEPEPLVAEDELLQDGVVVGVGLVVHHPSAGHKLELGSEVIKLCLFVTDIME